MLAIDPEADVRDAAPLQLYGKYTTTFLKVRPHKGDYQYANHNF